MADPIRERYAQAQAHWPQVEVEFERFHRRLVECAEASGEDVGDALQRLHVDDLYLACGCADGDSAALKEFERILGDRGIAGIRTLDSAPAFIDEVSQRVRDKLLVGRDGRPPRIVGYAGRGSLASWIGVSSVRTGLNLLKEQKRADRFEGEGWSAALAIPATGDVELDYLKQRYKDQFGDGLRHACDGLSRRDRAVLRLHFIDGLNIGQIGTMYGVHRATVARWIARAREELYTGTREYLASHLGVSGSELNSVDRLVRSQLDVSLSGLFATPEPKT